MVEADSGFITEVPDKGGPPENDQQVVPRDVDDYSADEDQFSQDEDEKEDNQYF